MTGLGVCAILITALFGMLLYYLPARRGCNMKFWLIMGMLFGPFALPFIFFGCAGTPTKSSLEPPLRTSLPSIHYTIQAGAFSDMENAVRFADKLRRQGLDPYHFVDSAGLYKVRFGNFPSETDANNRAKKLLSAGIINGFYVVAFENYSTADLRNKILRTADSFIGMPYRWGGESAEKGFDCSGLTSTVYQINGLELPRSSQGQWNAGVPVIRSRLKKGDLVFFHTAGMGKISHVGIYDGNGQFIHAPGRGKKVKRTSLNNRYFKKKYAGAKTYF